MSGNERAQLIAELEAWARGKWTGTAHLCALLCRAAEELRRTPSPACETAGEEE